MVVSSLTLKQRMLIEEVSHYFIAISHPVPYRCVSGASAVQCPFSCVLTVDICPLPRHRHRHSPWQWQWFIVQLLLIIIFMIKLHATFGEAFSPLVCAVWVKHSR